MNILLTNYYGFDSGGSQKSTFELAQALQEKGHNIFIASNGKYPNCSVKQFEGFIPLAFVQKTALTGFFEKIIEDEKIDVVHAQERMTSFAAVNACLKKSVPSIVHFRDYWFSCTNSTCLTRDLKDWEGNISDYTESFGFPRFFWELLKSAEINRNFFLLKKAGVKIVPSKAVKEKLMEKGISDAVVVPNFVEKKEPKILPQTLRKKHGLKSKVVFFAGRFSYEKGVFVLLKAAEKVLEKKNDVSFVFAGDGPLKQKALSMEESSAVKFLGNLGFDEISSYYNISDVVVVPSFMEAFGRTAVEAFSFKKPVIASNAGGLKDIVKENFNGFVFPRGDHEILAKKINEILDDSQKAKKMGENGYNDFSFKFSKEIIVKKIEQIYFEVTGA